MCSLLLFFVFVRLQYLFLEAVVVEDSKEAKFNSKSKGLVPFRKVINDFSTISPPPSSTSNTSNQKFKIAILSFFLKKCKYQLFIKSLTNLDLQTLKKN